MVAYEEALNALERGTVPLILPVEEGVILFEIVPGPPFKHVSQVVREQAHIHMAIKGVEKIRRDREDYPEDGDLYPC